MAQRTDRKRPAVGDVLVIATAGHSARHPDRRGTILALLGAEPSVRCLVSWSYGHESVVPAGVGTVLAAAVPGHDRVQ